MFSQTAQAEFHETSDSDSQAEDREYFNEKDNSRNILDSNGAIAKRINDSFNTPRAEQMGRRKSTPVADSSHNCLYCERKFGTKHGLNIHISRMHKVIDIFSI